MTKATQALTYLVAFLALWTTLMAGIIPLPESLQFIVAVSPLWILVTFGAYLLGTLGWNIFTFKDKEDAYKSLLGEIEEAKTELRAKGVTVD
ncbi:Putative uncharacterized protein [Taphrina deformans PYCC 5710]|uniref:Dolichol-phosphate mannosyltransferase subunit 3 n=1 Tax=Taphrina deformans (strain PYCC 5710 / ATCC 11124 / CBS 356.35 / IMI 108563 / JCM 9778 / NBRC 8474) TaxID=1097556 RepID=R4XJ34_TAPDE|nr:Putative uncharacterized protein [Taphrina deformans PYCC 5710]|eukprot:CCG83385.1 Putative uncharacterized protein [Taphrina deformans PYCC 5710]